MPKYTLRFNRGQEAVMKIEASSYEELEAAIKSRKITPQEKDYGPAEEWFCDVMDESGEDVATIIPLLGGTGNA